MAKKKRTTRAVAKKRCMKMRRYLGMPKIRGEADRELRRELLILARRGVTHVHFSPECITEYGSEKFHKGCALALRAWRLRLVTRQSSVAA